MFAKFCCFRTDREFRYLAQTVQLTSNRSHCHANTKFSAISKAGELSEHRAWPPINKVKLSTANPSEITTIDDFQLSAGFPGIEFQKIQVPRREKPLA